MKTILVPTDFSKNALNATKYAFAYAEKTKSKIVIFHSYESSTSINDEIFPVDKDEKKKVKLNAESRVKKLLSSLLKYFPNARPKFLVQEGIASENIAEYVKNSKPDLVIMGTTGQGAVAKIFMGSTTSSVIDHVQCSVIAVPPKAKFKGINKIGFATDLEKENLVLADEIIALAKQNNAEITLVHVQDLQIVNAEKIMEKAIEKIKDKTHYNKISLYVSKDVSVEDGLDYFVRKFKPEVLVLVKYNIKFPETIWKKNWTNKMLSHLSIPLFIIHSRNHKAAKKKASKVREDLVLSNYI